MMRGTLKNRVIALGIGAMVLFSFWGWYSYETGCKITFIERLESLDGRVAVIFQMRGEAGKPFFDGAVPVYPDMTKGRVIVEREGEKLKTEDFMLFNWGEPLGEDNWEVLFYPAGVEIILMDYGTDSRSVMKEGEHIVVYYSESGEFEGYSEAEIISEITARYDDQVAYLKEEGGEYYFQADGFIFSVRNDFWMTDDYEASYFGYLAQQFSYGHNRITEFEKSESEAGEATYIPVVGFHGRQPGEVESFSNACCDLVEELQGIVGFDRIGYFEADNRCYFELASYLENYDRTELYNALYRAVEKDSLEAWQYWENRADSEAQEEGASGANSEVREECVSGVDNEARAEGASRMDKETPQAEVSEEMPEEWARYEADCFYRKEDGTELRMVGVDRAAGSSYYVLLKAEGGVNTSVVNRDPYLGHGGSARWIDFLDGDKIGFSCLAYSGGSLGSLYRTEDGGKSFQEITYPSAEIKLPDNTLYNPFIIPDKIWEENGTLYMMAGQGPDGDYYENGIWVYGLYQSEDMGKNWTYTGTMEGEDYR